MKMTLAIAIVTTALLGTSASAQTKDRSSTAIVASGGGNDIHKEQRPVEKNSPCTKQTIETRNGKKGPDGNSFYEAWPDKWAKGEPSSDGHSECRDMITGEGGGSGI